MLSRSSPGSIPPHRRPAVAVLAARLREPRRFIQVVTGPRQVGKTTMVRQAVVEAGLAVHSASADDPGLRDRGWLEAQWQTARTLIRSSPGGPVILVLDEIQKIPAWSEIVKRLWDEDTGTGRGPRVVLLGSAPMVVEAGLADSLAGRFEEIRLGHWGFGEMRDAFGWDLERYLFFGGYPGSVPLADDVERWRAYVLDSLIETALSRDILLLTRVDKPALLRQLFRLGCDLSGQIVAFQKLVGQLQEAGNTTTLARYLHLLGAAGLLTGLPKFSGSRPRSRGSSPKLLALDTGLMNAMSGLTPEEVTADASYRGRLVETAVGAHLVNAAGRSTAVSWWRDRDREVDFVLSGHGAPLGIEVASGRHKSSLSGLAAFARAHGARSLLIGAQGLPLEAALLATPEDLLAA